MSLDAASRELVHAARRAARLHVLVRALECAAAGALGGAIVFAAGLASGARVELALLVVSSGVAVLTCAIAWRERSPRADDVVRRADRAAGLEGALPAVLDVARRNARATNSARVGGTARSVDDVAELLAARVRAAVRPLDLARAALPRTPIALAAPLLGAALVVLALERRPDAVPSPGSGTAAALRGAAERSRAAGSPVVADALEIAARRAAAAEATLGTATPVAEPAARERIEADLEQLARSLAADDPGRVALAEALRQLGTSSGARSTLARPDPTSDASAGRGSDPRGAADRAPDGADGSSSATPGLANASGDGRMLGPPAGGESDPQSGGPLSGTVATGGAGRGVLSARWWPSRYDAVVERYLTP